MSNDAKKAAYEKAVRDYASVYRSNAAAPPTREQWMFQAGYDHAKSEMQGVRDAATALVERIDAKWDSMDIAESLIEQQFFALKTALSYLDSKENANG